MLFESSLYCGSQNGGHGDCPSLLLLYVKLSARIGPSVSQKIQKLWSEVTVSCSVEVKMEDMYGDCPSLLLLYIGIALSSYRPLERLYSPVVGAGHIMLLHKQFLQGAS